MAGCISNELGIPELSVGLNYLSTEDLEKYYAMAMKLYAKSSAMTAVKDAEAFRRASFERLYSMVVGSMKAREQRPPSKLVPSTPAFNFNVYTEDPARRGEKPTVGTPLSIPYSSALQTLFCEIVAFLEKERSEGRRVKRVKVGVLGSDNLLQLVAGTYIVMCKEFPQNAEKFLVDFYLIPVEECSFGLEFSRVDSWFRTHVCEALRYAEAISPPFLFAKDTPPTLRHFTEAELQSAQQQRESRVHAEDGDSVSSKDYSGYAIPNPPMMVEKILSGFFSDARTSFRLPISLCQCWQMEGRFTVSFPFFTECKTVPQNVHHLSFCILEWSFAIVLLLCKYYSTPHFSTESRKACLRRGPFVSHQAPRWVLPDPCHRVQESELHHHRPEMGPAGQPRAFHEVIH